MACVALGANLGDAVATVQQALRDVAGLPEALPPPLAPRSSISYHFPCALIRSLNFRWPYNLGSKSDRTLLR